MNYIIREIQEQDDERMCQIIRDTLTEYGGNKPGTAYYDYDTEHMYEAYQQPKSVYYVAVIDNKVVGGCGLKQVAGGDLYICELQKLYLDKNYRGWGIGKALTQKCLSKATELGFKKCYLETFSNMNEAISLYSRLGFHKLTSALGQTGHDACDVQMIKDL